MRAIMTNEDVHPPRGTTSESWGMTTGRADRARVLLVISVLAVTVRAASRRRNNRVACGRVS